MSKPRLEKNRLGLALINGCCDKPHAYIRGSKLAIRSHHEHETHTLELTPDDLRRLADEIEAEGLPRVFRLHKPKTSVITSAA